MHDLLKQPDPGPRPRIPVVEDGDQPVRVRREGRVRHSAWRWLGPGAVREQEVNAGRSEVGERLIRPHWIVTQANPAGQAAIQARETLQPSPRRRYPGVTAPAAG